MLDGYLNKCKECCKLSTRLNRLDKIDHYRNYEKSRQDRRYSESMESLKSSTTIRNKKYPERKKANNSINNALRDNRIIRPNYCEYCGKNCIPNAHHASYAEDMFLLVTWLCSSCHNTLHRHFEFNL